jgi:ornithine carbamoyltransferase
MPSHYLRVGDLTREETEAVFELSVRLKNQLKTGGSNDEILKNKTMAMIFEKPSLRTRTSFEIGMTQLGGHAVYLGPSDIQMGKRETTQDVGIVTSSMADVIMARVFEHASVDELAKGSVVPVINGLSDLEHPCQVLADFMTIGEQLGRMRNLTIAWLGDGNNNVTHSLALMALMFGNEIRIGAPKGYQMAEAVQKTAKLWAKQYGGTLVETDDPAEAIKGADVVVTDTWVSMGAEEEAKERLKIFPPYQVTEKLMKEAHKSAIFMHCLPAYRGKEVEASVIDGPQSVVYQEAENRLHAQKGLVVYLLTR